MALDIISATMMPSFCRREAEGTGWGRHQMQTACRWLVAAEWQLFHESWIISLIRSWNMKSEGSLMSWSLLSWNMKSEAWCREVWCRESWNEKPVKYIGWWPQAPLDVVGHWAEVAVHVALNWKPICIQPEPKHSSIQQLQFLWRTSLVQQQRMLAEVVTSWRCRPPGSSCRNHLLPSKTNEGSVGLWRGFFPCQPQIWNLISWNLQS